MPIKIPNNLPAKKILENENIFVMTKLRAETQDIRPLKILLVNLMPTKIQTETQFARVLGNTPLQIDLELLAPKSHIPHNTGIEHLQNFYKTFDEIKNNKYDGCVITGAPVEHLEFEEVDYWKELCEIMEWTNKNVYSTLHICWGAQAGLYYHYGIKKHKLDEKLFGVFEHKIIYKNAILLRGFDDAFYVPHSRHTTVKKSDIEKIPELKILAESDKAGVNIIFTKNGKKIFVFGHSEYDVDTLKNEYDRDVSKGLPIKVPENYFLNNDPKNDIIVKWRAHANLFYSNWLNYIVYQETPYNIESIGLT